MGREGSEGERCIVHSPNNILAEENSGGFRFQVQEGAVSRWGCNEKGCSSEMGMQ